MSSSSDEYVLVGDHAENLTSGALIGPGETVTADQLDDADQWLVDDGRLRLVSSFKPTADEIASITDGVSGETDRKALNARASEMGIETPSKLAIDDLRSAIVEAEAATAERQSNPTGGE